MDETKKYIDMCVEAFKDIGCTKSGTLRCLMILRSDDTKGVFLHIFEADSDYILENNTIIGQLYYQDQLQEMLGYERAIYLAGFFNDWASNEDGYYKGLHDFSMEQLWLAFVMKEKFNKEWRDGAWKKAE